MSVPALHFLYCSELDEHARSKVPWRTLRLDKCSEDGQPLGVWEDVRYMLELKCGLHGTSKCSRGFLSGMRRKTYKENGCTWVDACKLKGSDAMKAGDAVVLLRRPLPKALRMYVPPRFDPDVVAAKQKAVVAEQERALMLSSRQAELDRKMQHMSEEERLLAIAGGAADARELMPSALSQAGGTGSRRGVHHPDDYKYESLWTRPLPPEEYVCKGCGEQGVHFRVDCPREAEVVVAAEHSGVTVKIDTAVDKIQLSHGIPKMFLKRVNLSSVPGESGGGAKASLAHAKEALTTREGEMVVDVRSTLAKPVITIEQESVLQVLAATPAPPRDVDDEEDMWFSFEAYLDVHDRLYARELDKVYDELPHLRKKLQSMCTHWLRGICHKGVLCEYMHIYSVEGIPICKFYLQGKCLNDECMYRHTLPPSARGRHTSPCLDYATGFCARGPRCPQEHVRRDAPYIADFPGKEQLFNQVVAAFDRFVTEEKKDEVKARKQYALTPAGAKRLHTAVRQTVGQAGRGAKRSKPVVG